MISHSLPAVRAHALAARLRRRIAFGKVAILLLILPLAFGCSQEATPSKQASPASSTSSASDPVVARVNGVEIRQSDLTMAEEDLGQELQAAPPAMKREQLIAYVADVILVAQAAESKKMGDTPDFKQRLNFMRNKLLMGAQLQQEAKTAATDEAMRKVYDEQVKPMGAEEEVRARHILVATEEEAKAIVDEIKGGADFAALAKEKSKDPGAADGGDLGYFAKDQMVPEFAEVAFRMHKGQLSNPVKTQFGWHVIKLEDRRNKQVPEFDKIKEQIVVFLARKAQTEYVAKLREGAKIERLDQPAAKPMDKPADKPADKPGEPEKK